MKTISRNLELRFFSSNPAADGETDFKGETSILTTQQRVDYLNAYAEKLPEMFEDFSLERPVVTLEEARERLKQIKPQPRPKVRKRIDLEDWKWTGYREGDEERQKPDYGTGILPIPQQDWRCALQCGLDEETYRDCRFCVGEAAVAGFDGDGKPYYISKGKRYPVELREKARSLKLEVDFVSGRFNLYLNERLAADFVEFSKEGEKTADFLRVPMRGSRPAVSNIWGVEYHRLTESPFEPFSIHTFLDDDFTEPVRMNGWNRAGYDDSGWKEGRLPIVHGGERYAGQDLYLRRTFRAEEVPDCALLYLESLTPGGEVYLNGRLAAFVQKECCHSVDVTEFLQPGENLIAVRVYADQVKERDKMTHTQTDLHTGWFAGRMHLDLLPAIYLEDGFAWTEEIRSTDALVRLRTSVRGIRGMASAKACPHEIRASIRPWYPQEGETCAEASWQTRVLPNISEETEAQLSVPSPKLWTTDSPNLYQVTLELVDPEGNIVDDLVFTTGIRTVSQEGGVFRINGKPELLRAPLLFGARPPLDKIAAWDRCPPAEYYVQEMLMVRRMNGNGLRMSVHDRRIGGSNDPRVCELADQLGIMLVWQTTTWLRITSATNLDLQELAACIRQVRNHCSIVIWQPMNHPSWKDWDTVMRVYRGLLETIGALDPSRLISPSADSRRIRPRWDDGLTDFEGNACDSCDPAWTAEGICRGNMDYILGYGNEWSALREWPHVRPEHLPAYMDSTDYIPSYLDSPERAYFNFEHDEIIGQPNWKNHQGKPTYQVKSYEKDYDEGSIGRELGFEEWLTSQAWQALGAYETICKCRWLDYDGLCWCNLRGGLNTGTYQKSLVDYEGQPKLAWYAHQMAFQNVLACSGNVDMVYGPDDRLPLIVMNLGEEKMVDIRVQLFSRDGGTLYEREYRNVCLPEGRSCTSVDELKLPETEGICSIVYTVLEREEGEQK